MHRIVWMESMTTSSGFSFSIRPQISSTSFSAARKILSCGTFNRAARSLTWRTDSSPVIYGVLVGDSTAELQQHGGFAHARLTTQQHDAAQHDAAAQHTVKLGDASQNAALLLGGTDVSQPLCGQRGDAFLTDRGSRLAAGKTDFGCLSNHILVHGIPAAAARAAAHPAGACLPAVGADINSFQFRLFHKKTPAFLIHFPYCSIPGAASQEKLTLKDFSAQIGDPCRCAAQRQKYHDHQQILPHQFPRPGTGLSGRFPEGVGPDAPAHL